jgi:diguanylate cyclase (GGDEF)-like protein
MDRDSGVFGEEAFRHLLLRETQRATRYQDFFSVCLARADAPTDVRPRVTEAVSRKITEFLRSTDLVGRLSDGIGILLLHAEGQDTERVAERIRRHIEGVAFTDETGASCRVTLSVGAVSFPRDGHNDTLLLSQAAAHLARAAESGGNRVVQAIEGRG